LITDTLTPVSWTVVTVKAVCSKLHRFDSLESPDDHQLNHVYSLLPEAVACMLKTRFRLRRWRSMNVSNIGV